MDTHGLPSGPSSDSAHNVGSGGNGSSGGDSGGRGKKKGGKGKGQSSVFVRVVQALAEAGQNAVAFSSVEDEEVHSCLSHE